MKHKHKLKGNRLLLEENRKPKYGLRKLSIGVVSCFLGCAIYFGFGGGITVHAQENTPVDTTEVSNIPETVNIIEETPTNEEEPTDKETFINGETSLQPNHETVENNDSSEGIVETVPSETEVTETNAEVSEKPLTSVEEERSAELVTQPVSTLEERASDDMEEESLVEEKDDDSLKKEGTISYSGLEDSDIDPVISEPNNARLDWTATAPEGLGFDPDKERFTIGIIDYDSTYSAGVDNHSTYKKQTDKDYYITVSVDSIHKKERSEDVYITVFDKATGTKVGSTVISVGEVDKAIPGTKHTEKSGKGDIELSVSYTKSSSGAVLNIKYPQRFNNGQNHPYITSAFDAVVPSKVGNHSDQIQYKVPSISSLSTYYALKGENGQPDTILASYKNTGLEGSEYTMSDKREIAGFDLSEEPENKTIILSERYVDGKTYLDYAPTGSALNVYKNSNKGIVTVRAITAVGTAGDGIVKILKADINNYDVNDLDNTDMWEPMYESEVLAPGEWGTTGNSNFHAGHPLGGFNDGFNVHYKILNPFLRLDKEPVYYYTPQGVVRVHYIDKDGNVIKDLVSAKTDGTTKTASATNVADVNDPTKVLGTVDYNYNKANTSYDVSTPEYKLDKIEADDGSIYYYTETKTATNTESTETVTVAHLDGTSDSFSYKTVDAPTAGTVDSATLYDITYVYEKGGNVEVKYFTLDEDGNVGQPLSGSVEDLADRKTVSETEKDTVWGKVGTEYSTADLRPSIIIDDQGNKWELVADRTNGDPEEGFVESDVTKLVNYYYTPVKTGDVIVHYINEEGKTIKEDAVDTPETSTGTAYDTTDNKPTRIVTEDGRTYELVPTKTVGDETGEVVEGRTEVTYVYREVKEEKPIVPPTTSTLPEQPTNPVPPKTQTPPETTNVATRLPKTGEVTNANVAGVFGGLLVILGALLTRVAQKTREHIH
ncbi:MucBP domain-containing protein [Clostridium perfringens]|uniref:Putative muramidase-released protein n=1 Tax=Clostridium perfringens E str. JGS1987 TaxID=451755 RepID=B1BVU5_CLOPF|nr:MucBP domain-containing protein [Clostridium perfringens]EDT14198.1 putative muramidase-released protein [Clostridium perfringens E str. JGS1987]